MGGLGEFLRPISFFAGSIRRYGLARLFPLVSGGHRLTQFGQDIRVEGADAVLIEGSVGLGHTMVQTLKLSDQAERGQALEEEFIRTLARSIPSSILSGQQRS